MKTLFAVAILSSALCAQPATLPTSGSPVVGFLTGPGPLELTPILGIASAANLAAPRSAPPGTLRLYLPPRQQYALAEQQPGQPIAVWDLQNPQNLVPIATALSRHALSQATLAVFSPKGMSAALYSAALGRLQIVTGLPGMATLKEDVSTESLGTIFSLAVSDDGTLVIARNDSGQSSLWSGASTWRLLPWDYSPLAWSFISTSHDLVLSDAHQSGLLLFHRLDGPNGPPVYLSLAGAHPDSLAVTSDGANIIAADSLHRTLWSIELKTGSVQALSAQCGQTPVVTLRDGHTFFLSSAPDSSFSLLKLASASAQPVILIHPGASHAISHEAAQ